MTLQSPFRLDKENARLMGVCAGIANYFGIEALWVRIAAVVLVLAGFWFAIPIYIAIGLLADNSEFRGIATRDYTRSGDA